MKKLTFLILLFPVVVFCQLPPHFKLVDGKFYFDKVYEVPGQDSTAIAQLLSAKFPSFKYSETNYEIDYRKLGYKPFDVSIIIKHAEYFFDVVIQVKDEKYRVITTDHKYRTSVDFETMGLSNNDNSLTSYESMFIKNNGKVRSGESAQTNLLILSKSLDDYFGSLYDHAQLINQDW